MQQHFPIQDHPLLFSKPECSILNSASAHKCLRIFISPIISPLMVGLSFCPEADIINEIYHCISHYQYNNVYERSKIRYKLTVSVLN